MKKIPSVKRIRSYLIYKLFELLGIIYRKKLPIEVADRGWYFMRQYGLQHPPKYPETVSLQPISWCNLKCSMCPYHSGDIPDSHMSMNMDLYKKIIDRIKGKVPYLGLAGMGEPALCKTLPEMVHYAHNAGIDVRITTNGLLWNEKLANEIFSAGLNRLRISIDGATQQTYEKIRDGAHFDRLLKNLEMISSVKQAGNYNTKIDIHSVFQRDNMHEFYLFKEKYKRFADKLSCTLPCTFGDHDTSFFPVPPIKPFDCTLLATTLSIKSNGDISICCNNYNAKDIVGNANTDDIIDIWNGEMYKKFRHIHFKGEFEKISLCQNCMMCSKTVTAEMIRLYK